MVASDIILKKCRYCNKEVRNLGLHIVNIHPNILDQIEERIPQSQDKNPTFEALPRQIDQNKPIGDINAMIREKLDTMLNIKIIEMLSKNPDTSLQQISQALNPPAPIGLKEIKEYHDLIYQKEEKEIPETGNQWIDLATSAIPLVRDMLHARKNQEVKQDEPRINEERDLRVLKPISLEAPGDTSQPASFSEESGAISEAK